MHSVLPTDHFDFGTGKAGLRDGMAGWEDSCWWVADSPLAPGQVSYIVLGSGVVAAAEARSPAVDIEGYGLVGSGVEVWVVNLDSHHTRVGWHNTAAAEEVRSVVVDIGRPSGCMLLGSCAGCTAVGSRSLRWVRYHCRLGRQRVGNRLKWRGDIGQ